MDKKPKSVKDEPQQIPVQSQASILLIKESTSQSLNSAARNMDIIFNELTGQLADMQAKNETLTKTAQAQILFIKELEDKLGKLEDDIDMLIKKVPVPENLKKLHDLEAPLKTVAKSN